MRDPTGDEYSNLEVMLRYECRGGGRSVSGCTGHAQIPASAWPVSMCELAHEKRAQRRTHW